MSKRFIKPTPQEVTEYAKSIEYILDGEAFCDFYESKGWVVGKSPMKSWPAAVRTWKRMDKKRHGQPAAPTKVKGKTLKDKYLDTQDEQIRQKIEGR